MIVGILYSTTNTESWICLHDPSSPLNYKHHCFETFLKQERRDSRLFWGEHSLANLREYFSQIDLGNTWKQLACSNGAGRSALLGSYRSPLCNYRADPGKYSSQCPHCGHESASHEHVFWECPEFHEKPDVPDNPLQKRFGWFSQDTESSKKISVTCAMWLRKLGICLLPLITKAVNGKNGNC